MKVMIGDWTLYKNDSEQSKGNAMYSSVAKGVSKEKRPFQTKERVTVDGEVSIEFDRYKNSFRSKGGSERGKAKEGRWCK